MNGSVDRRLFATAAILGALGLVFFAFHELRPPWSSPPFDPDSVTRITIERGAERAVLERIQADWVVGLQGDMLHGSEHLPLRMDRLQSLMDSWSAGRTARRTLLPTSEPEDLQAYGLGPRERTRLTFTVAGTEITLLLGRTLGAETAALQDGRVLAVPTNGPVPSASSIDWADRSVLPRPGSVETFSLGTGGETRGFNPGADRAAHLFLDGLSALKWTRALPIASDFHNYDRAVPIAMNLTVNTNDSEIHLDLTEPLAGGLVFVRRGTTLLQVGPEDAAALLRRARVLGESPNP